METNIFPGILTHIKIIIYRFVYSFLPLSHNSLQTSMAISMDLRYSLISESMDLQQAAELNSTRNVKASDVYFHWELWDRGRKL
jgi:hypothetical protein